MNVERQHLQLAWRWMYEGLQAHFEQGRPMHQALDLLPIDGPSLAQLARLMQEPLGHGIGHDDALLDAMRRLETQISCPAFRECPLSACEGTIWCKAYNLGGSHGVELRERGLSREQHRLAILETIGDKLG